jgi:hypothetical protein
VKRLSIGGLGFLPGFHETAEGFEVIELEGGELAAMDEENGFRGES